MKLRAFVLAAAVVPAMLGAVSSRASAQTWSMPADFSPTQGQRNWFYGYRNEGGVFTQMSQYGLFPASWTSQWGSGGFWTLVAPNLMHPNGATTSGQRQGVNQSAVLRWVSPTRGSAAISGTIAKQLPGGNGVDWSVVKNGTQSLASFTLAGDNAFGQSFQSIVRVRPGDTIDFMLGAHEGNDGGDLTIYTVAITVCQGDLDDGTNTGQGDGAVTIDDLIYFLDRYEAGDLSADLDDGSGNGVPNLAVDVDDFVYFILRFDAGC